MGLRGFPFSAYFLQLQVFSILAVILAVLSEVCQAQHTFVLESVQQLNFRNASLLVSGYTLSDFSITTYPLDEVYQFRYFTVDQDRHISAQLTTRFGDKIYKWTVAESYSSPLICDQKSNVVQIINVPTTNYFYGINAQLVTGSNCSSALLLWDILPSPLGPITEQSFALANLPATASMTHATFSGSSFLVLSSFNVFNVALKTMGYISGPQTYIFTHLCADWDNSFPVWGIDISAATIRLFNTPTPGTTFTQITVSNMPAVNLGIPVGAKKLSGVSDSRMLLVTPSSIFLIDTSTSQASILTGNSTGMFSALEIDPAAPITTFTVLRGVYLQSYSLITSPYSLKLITQVNVSAYNLAPRNIRYAGSDTFVGISSTQNQLYLFSAKKQCDSACATCFGTTNQSCFTCVREAITSATNNFSCTRCPEGSHANSSQTNCINCAAGCASCPQIQTSPSAECPQCFSGLKKKLNDPRGCVVCPSDGFYSYNTDYCNPCDPSCRRCSSSSPSSCSECNFGYYLQSSQCIGCSVSNCESCNSAGTCFKCRPGYVYQTGGTCVKCADTNCAECFATGLSKCTLCNTGYYVNLTNNTCTLCPQNCTGCTTATFCTSCITGFTLIRSSTVPNVCINLTLGSGYFLYQIGGQSYSEICDSNCRTCVGVATNCTDCKDYFYLQNSVCYPCKENCTKCLDPFVCTNCSNTTYLSSSNKTCTLCGDGLYVDTNGLDCYPCNPICLECTSATVCQKCDVSTGYYLDGTTCIHYSSFTSLQGIDLADDSVKPCLDVACLNCKPNYTLCLVCDESNSYYRFQNGCKNKTSFLEYEGVDFLGKSVRNCTSPHCTNCTDNYQECKRCDFVNNWYLNETGFCVEVTRIPTGQGLNIQNSSILRCKVSHCISCEEDYAVCRNCNSSSHHFLVDGLCRYSFVSLVVLQIPTKSAAQDLLFEFIPSGESVEPPVLLTAFRSFQSNATIEVSFLQEEAPGEIVTADFKGTKEAGATAATFSIKFQTYLPGQIYKVSLFMPEMSFVHSDGTTYFLSSANTSVIYENPIDLSRANVLKQQQAAGEVLSSVAPGSSPAAGSITLAVIAMDPTGTFFRFTKMLQIIGRLYYLNINFGKRLDAFLFNTITKEKDSIDKSVRHSRFTRGKLTSNRVPLDSVQGQILWKLCLYWICWLFGTLLKVAQTNPKFYRSKFSIYSSYIVSRLHWAVFNILFGDLLWLVPRTLLHSRNLHWSLYACSFIACLMTGSDFVYLISHVSDKKRWRRFREWSSPSFSEKKPEVKPQVKSDVKQVVSPSSPNQPQTKQINYKKTYFEIECNFPLMEMVSGSFIPREIIGDSFACRYLCLSPWFRLVSIQLLISSCQYANQMAVTLMLANELFRLAVSVFVLLEYKLYKSRLNFATEVIQSLFLAAWLSMCLFLCSKRFDETVADDIQDTGVWLLLFSCFVEYVLLLMFVCSALYSFWKAKKLMNKMKLLKLAPPILHYVDTNSPVLKREKIAPRDLGIGDQMGKLKERLNFSGRTRGELSQISNSSSLLSSHRPLQEQPQQKARRAMRGLWKLTSARS